MTAEPDAAWTERMFAIARGMISATPYANALGFELVTMAPGRASMKAPYREDLIGDPESGVIAGGVVTALLDHTCGLATFTAMTSPSPIATLDLRIDYMRAAAPGKAVIAEAHCFKIGHAVAFVRAIAHDGDANDPVASGAAAFMLNSNAGRKAGSNRKPPK